MTNPDEPRQTSQARIDANRENAKKSTGPRSPSGKATSSRNRLLHGLRANKHILLDDDDPEDFLLLLKDLDNTFRPAGEAEEMLVTRIAADMWRLEHALPLEAGIFRQRLQAVDAGDYRRKRELINHKRNHERDPQIYSPAPDPPDPDDRLARAFTNDCATTNSLASLTRYRAAIQLSIDRNLRQLKIYQAARAETPTQPKQQVDPVEPIPPAQLEAAPAEPAVTPLESANYHSNPTNGDTAKLSVTAMLVAVLALLQALPELIAAHLRADPAIPPRRAHPPIKHMRPVQLHHGRICPRSWKADSFSRSATVIAPSSSCRPDRSPAPSGMPCNSASVAARSSSKRAISAAN